MYIHICTHKHVHGLGDRAVLGAGHVELQRGDLGDSKNSHRYLAPWPPPVSGLQIHAKFRDSKCMLRFVKDLHVHPMPSTVSHSSR